MAWGGLLGLDRTRLQPVVRRVLQDEGADVEAWQCRRTEGWSSGETTSGVFQVSGRARSQGRLRSWTVMLKILGGPGNGEAFQPEADAYASGLPGRLPAGLRAPRCHGVERRREQETWIWLEALDDAHPGAWPLALYGQAARALARFNAATMEAGTTTLPGWIPRGLLEARLQGTAGLLPLLAAPEAWSHPILRGVFPPATRERLLALWEGRGELLSALQRLPLALNHGDAHPANLLAVRSADGPPEIVALDWSTLHLGPLGTEAQALVGGALATFRADPAEGPALNGAVLRGYWAGLRERGQSIDPGLVHFAHHASAALRWTFGLAGWALRGAHDAGLRAEMEARRGRSFEAILRHRAGAIPFLLDLGDEAFRRLPGLAVR